MSRLAAVPPFSGAVAGLLSVKPDGKRNTKREHSDPLPSRVEGPLETCPEFDSNYKPLGLAMGRLKRYLSLNFSALGRSFREGKQHASIMGGWG